MTLNGMPPDPNPDLRLVDNVTVTPLDEDGAPLADDARSLGPAVIQYGPAHRPEPDRPIDFTTWSRGFSTEITFDVVNQELLDLLFTDGEPSG